MSVSHALPASLVISRVAAGLLGGYAFVWGFVTLFIALMLCAGMPYDDAQTLAFLLVFFVFLVVFCWAFAAPLLTRVWAVLLGGGALMTGAGWLIARALS